MIQIPSIVLPQAWTFGTETENIQDLVAHASRDIPIEYLQEKKIHIVATEVVVAGAPGNLWCWIELSPYDSATSTWYWEAIGGSVPAVTPAPDVPRVPIAPTVLVASGVTLTVHRLMLPWTMHSMFCRVCVQTPVAAAPLTAFWTVQALIAGASK